MALTYLELVNQVLSVVNEVPLTASNFSEADGLYATVKNAVKWSARRVTQQEFEWPFLNVQNLITLTPGQTRYTPPANCKTIDFDTFRVVAAQGQSTWTLSGGVWNDDLPWDDTQEWVDEGTGLTVSGRSVRLVRLDYDEYIHKYIEYEYDREKDRLPQAVFPTQDRKFGLYPAPDKAYTLVYEYFRYPEELDNPNDVLELPETFDRILVQGALIYIYQFKMELEAADRLERDFNQSLKDLRKLYINNKDYVRSSQICQPNFSSRYI
jgi:hypothetical protein